ncbi:26S proteasome subunit RPN7-domain-containing protein [Phlyctochytrium arcticum]|nr:26S proteasome subunit RPN7-domain-containing protein [Phlyctochytrium arcticum]
MDSFPPSGSRRPADSWGESWEESGDNKKKRTAKITVQNTSIDLDVFAANYTGHTKYERLLFIAERCPPLAAEAYRMALAEIKKTMDVNKYTNVYLKYQEARGEGADPIDQTWVETTRTAQRQKSERLERELKDYKINLIKESIRMGYNDLGDHLYDCGDLTASQRHYMKARDYCTTSKHIVDWALIMAKLSVAQGNFTHIQSYVSKIETTPEIPDRKLVNSKLACIMGLVHLDGSKYKKAARSFLDCSFELNNQFTDVMSPNDIAIYGTLCALASFDRAELKSHVFDNNEFKQYLELEPQIRELLNCFYNSQYTACLESLDSLRNDLYLDFWLHAHVDAIYDSIRRRALVQYFTPFLSVDLERMARAFNSSLASLEEELTELILAKEINARIDSHNKVLRVKSTDQRSSIFAKSITMGEDYQRQVRQAITRMKLIQADLIGLFVSSFLFADQNVYIVYSATGEVGEVGAG